MRWRRGLWLAVVLGVLIFALAGCGPQSDSSAGKTKDQPFAVIIDDLGREVAMPQKPQRIVVTSASFLEPLHEVGGDVVGRPDSKTVMPDYAKDKPSIGRVYQIDMEKLLACKPDLVIINKGMNEKLVEPLEANGIRTIVLSGRSYDQVKHEIKVLAAVTGEVQKGESIIQDMDGKITAIRSRIPQDKRRVAVIHSTSNGLTIQLNTSIAGSAAELLGWENTAAGLVPFKKDADAAQYSMETLVQENPEVIFVTSMGNLQEIRGSMEQLFAENPAWQSVPAVRDHRVYYLSQQYFLLSPGIHNPEAVEEMAKHVYPEAF